MAFLTFGNGIRLCCPELKKALSTRLTTCIAQSKPRKVIAPPPLDKEEAATPLRSVAPTFLDHNCGKGEGVRCILRRRASIKRRGEWDNVILQNHLLFLTHPRIAGPVRTLDGRSCRPRGAGCRRKSCNGSRPRAGESRRAPGMKKR